MGVNPRDRELGERSAVADFLVDLVGEDLGILVEVGLAVEVELGLRRRAGGSKRWSLGGLAGPLEVAADRGRFGDGGDDSHPTPTVALQANTPCREYCIPCGNSRIFRVFARLRAQPTRKSRQGRRDRRAHFPVHVVR